jgi:hypothetical protein
LIHQDASIYASILNDDDQIRHELAPGRIAYLHVVQGKVSANGTELGSGDALKVSGESALTLTQGEKAEVLLFDLPH